MAMRIIKTNVYSLGMHIRHVSGSGMTSDNAFAIEIMSVGHRSFKYSPPRELKLVYKEFLASD